VNYLPFQGHKLEACSTNQIQNKKELVIQ